MNNEIDTEKIRELLKEAKLDFVQYKNEQQGVRKINQALSLLPPPCKHYRKDKGCEVWCVPLDEEVPQYLTCKGYSVCPDYKEAKKPCEKCDHSLTLYPSMELQLKMARCGHFLMHGDWQCAKCDKWIKIELEDEWMGEEGTKSKDGKYEYRRIEGKNEIVACQPAGEIEEFVKAFGKMLDVVTWPDGKTIGSPELKVIFEGGRKACTHLTALLKQIKDAEHALELAKTMIDTRAKWCEQLEQKLEFGMARFEMMRTALIQKQKQVEQLEAENKELEERYRDYERLWKIADQALQEKGE